MNAQTRGQTAPGKMNELVFTGKEEDGSRIVF